MKTIACACGNKVRVGDNCESVKCSICVINEHTVGGVVEPQIDVNQLVEDKKDAA